MVDEPMISPYMMVVQESDTDASGVDVVIGMTRPDYLVETINALLLHTSDIMMLSPKDVAEFCLDRMAESSD